MEQLLDLALLVGGLFYGIFAIWLLVGVRRSRRLRPSDTGGSTRPSVSVIVAARNEAETIPTCLGALSAQNYEGALQVVVIDDRSQDGTADLVREASSAWPEGREILLVEAPDPPLHAGPKKNALAGGIRASSGELLLFTDADCRPPPTWVTSMVSSFRDPTVGVVAGYADRDTAGFLHRILAVDELGIGALGEGGIGHGMALSCTGRSLAYRRSLYDEVGGFNTIGHLVSGDDVYFLRHVAAVSAAGLVYNAQPEAIVRDARNVSSIREVVSQKLRHASKASRYRGGARWLGLGVYVYHGLLAFGLWQILQTLPSLGQGMDGLFLGVWLSRWILDLALLWVFAPRPCDRRSLLYLPFAEFLYIPYVLLFIPLARIFGFRWRDASVPQG